MKRSFLHLLAVSLFLSVIAHAQPVKVTDGVKFVYKNAEASSVSLVGDFNDWSRASWPMTDSGQGYWEFSSPLAQFSGAETARFKFVVNDVLWVEPADNAINRMPTGFGNQSWNLEMILP